VLNLKSNTSDFPVHIHNIHDTECEKSYDEMGARPKDKSTRSTRPVMDKRDVSGLDIINVLKDTIEDSD
jgi:hypothetical protein